METIKVFLNCTRCASVAALLQRGSEEFVFMFNAQQGEVHTRNFVEMMVMFFLSGFFLLFFLISATFSFFVLSVYPGVFVLLHRAARPVSRTSHSSLPTHLMGPALRTWLISSTCHTWLISPTLLSDAPGSETLFQIPVPVLSLAFLPSVFIF